MTSSVVFIEHTPRTIKVNLGEEQDFIGDNFNFEAPTFGGYDSGIGSEDAAVIGRVGVIDSLEVTRGTGGMDYISPDPELLEQFKTKLQNSSVSGSYVDPNTELAPPTLTNLSRLGLDHDSVPLSQEKYLEALNELTEHKDSYAADRIRVKTGPGHLPDPELVEKYLGSNDPEPNTVIATLPVEGVGNLEIRSDGTVVSEGEVVGTHMGVGGNEPIIGIDTSDGSDHTELPLNFGEVKSRLDELLPPRTGNGSWGEISHPPPVFEAGTGVMYSSPPPLSATDEISDNPYLTPEMTRAALGSMRSKSGYMDPFESLERAKRLFRERFNTPQQGEFLGDEDAPVYTEETRWVGTPDIIEEPTIEEDPDADRFIS